MKRTFLNSWLGKPVYTIFAVSAFVAASHASPGYARPSWCTEVSMRFCHEDMGYAWTSAEYQRCLSESVAACQRANDRGDEGGACFFINGLLVC